MNAKIPSSFQIIVYTFQALYNYWTSRDLKTPPFPIPELIMLAMEPTIVPKMEIPSHFSHYRHHTHSPGQGIIFKTREPWSSKSLSYSVFWPQSPSLSDSTLSRLLASFHASPTRPPTLRGPWCLVPIVAAGFQQLFSTFPSPSYPQQRE